MDPVKIAVSVGIAAMAVVITAVAYVVWHNTDSKNLVLGAATLCAAAVLFGLQLPFELQSKRVVDSISSEYTIDRAGPAIRQWIYEPAGGWRIIVETEASKKLAAATATSFSGDRDRLTTDFALYSLLSYFAFEHRDWQMRHTRYRGKTIGTVTVSSPISKDAECSVVTLDSLANLLRDAGNSFHEAMRALGSSRICLPPGTTVLVTEKSVGLRNRFYDLTFSVEVGGGVFYTKPGSQGEAPEFEGKAQYETRPIHIDVTASFSGFRSYHREMPRYRDWVTRVLEGAHSWFES